MKNFLRYLVIIFLLVVVVTVVRGLARGGETLPQNEGVEEGEEILHSENPSETILTPETPPITDDEEDEGVIILGGDGIPNN